MPFSDTGHCPDIKLYDYYPVFVKVDASKVCVKYSLAAFQFCLLTLPLSIFAYHITTTNKPPQKKIRPPLDGTTANVLCLSSVFYFYLLQSLQLLVKALTFHSQKIFFHKLVLFTNNVFVSP